MRDCLVNLVIKLRNVLITHLDIWVDRYLFTEEIVGGEETLQPLPVYHHGRPETGGQHCHCLLCLQRITCTAIMGAVLVAVLLAPQTTVCYYYALFLHHGAPVDY